MGRGAVYAGFSGGLKEITNRYNRPTEFLKTKFISAGKTKDIFSYFFFRYIFSAAPDYCT